MSTRDAVLNAETLPVTVNPAAAYGQVLIMQPAKAMAADIARELATAGWLAATTGNANAVERGHPAALIVDTTGHDAWDAAGVARIRRSAPGAPVLFLTTRETLESLLTGGTLPGDDYMIAPFTPADVALRLGWLTRHGTPARRDPELTVGDLSLRPRRLLARRGDHQIPLTKTQCAVLQLLMQDPGNVVRKDEIMNQIWPGTPGRGGNNVELYISYLRRKINAAGPPMIHTLRGVGYLIKPAPADPESAAQSNQRLAGTEVP
ncbi:two-component system, OmpR family, response regulator [Arthrobacter sp. ok909]|uniref:response regulator transcription factor n=1 Tax=Arthrobacter sp. ok909 TaxID=1761746 RepID=UPI00088A4575|nr:response regulator transcription factor [Arthrobacter sp. ok909]SDP85091.1 two-component system, OmpR family, response regulator [Arthrobacter sp. ok909]